MFDNLLLGLSVALTPENMLFALLGCLCGTLVGVLPGIAPIATISILLPLTYHMEPVTGMIMLAGIFYGAQYGGSTTAILINIPGEASSIVTCLDGHQMARRGRAGAALAIAALGSLFAGIVATLLIAFLSPAMVALGLKFGAPEYAALVVFGLVSAVLLASGSVVQALLMILLGLLLSTVGIDLNTGQWRMTFGLTQLVDGIDIVPLAIGLFGITQVIVNLTRREEQRQLLALGSDKLWPSGAEARRAAPAVVRGTLLGSLLGVLPGGGATLSAFASYALEKKMSRRPEEFGKGAVEGLAGPEAANNAAAQTSFIPMLALGIPGNAVMAIIIGALTIHGIQPGPRVYTQHPELVWGLIASMLIGNVMLVVLNLPLIGIWVRLLRVPYRLLYLAILMFCMIGVYTVSNSFFDLYLAALFGVMGYVLHRLRCEPAPLLLGFVLGPMLEQNVRRSLLISQGDPAIFVSRPISAALLVATVGLIVLMVLPSIRGRREEAFSEPEA